MRIYPLMLLVGLTGCSWIDNYDRNELYLEAEATPEVVIPEGLDQPQFVDAMTIPQVIDSRGIAGQRLQVTIPQALSTTYGIEQIVLKKLGDQRWIFLDAPPSTVWPKVLQYWQDHNLEIQVANPREGVIESVWLISQDGEPEAMYESLISGLGWTDSTATVQNKLRLSVEPGIRSGSSEVYLEQQQIPLASDVPASVRWTGDSDNLGLENELLTKLAFYLGDKINEPVISVMAIENRGQKAELVPDRVKPILRYKLDFDRAWVTVGEALKSADVPIEDLDRTSKVYYVYYDQTANRNPGFLARMLGGGDKVLVDSHRYLVQLDTGSEDVSVTVLKDSSTLADAIVAERLLKIIKESSS